MNPYQLIAKLAIMASKASEKGDVNEVNRIRKTIHDMTSYDRIPRFVIEEVRKMFNL